MSDEENDFVKLSFSDLRFLDAQLKIVIIGSSGVGKTSLLKRLAHGVFEEDISRTKEVDVLRFNTTYGEHPVKLHLWDTVGMEKFRSLPSILLRDAEGVVLVYDVCSTSSFYELDDWYFSLEQFWSGTSNFPDIIVVGNKLDKEEREVCRHEGSKFAKVHRCMFLETSARTGCGVTKAFEDLVAKIMEARISREEISNNRHRARVRLSERTPPPRRRNRKCC